MLWLNQVEKGFIVVCYDAVPYPGEIGPIFPKERPQKQKSVHEIRVVDDGKVI